MGYIKLFCRRHNSSNIIGMFKPQKMRSEMKCTQSYSWLANNSGPWNLWNIKKCVKTFTLHLVIWMVKQIKGISPWTQSSLHEMLAVLYDLNDGLHLYYEAQIHNPKTVGPSLYLYNIPLLLLPYYAYVLSKFALILSNWCICYC
jgi:hypothetical protein